MIAIRYSPYISTEKAKRSAIEQLLRTFFNNSALSAMATLLDMSSSNLSETELKRLAQLISWPRLRPTNGANSLSKMSRPGPRSAKVTNLLRTSLLWPRATAWETASSDPQGISGANRATPAGSHDQRSDRRQGWKTISECPREDLLHRSILQRVLLGCFRRSRSLGPATLMIGSRRYDRCRGRGDDTITLLPSTSQPSG
jgi:hypothetical protein